MCPLNTTTCLSSTRTSARPPRSASSCFSARSITSAAAVDIGAVRGQAGIGDRRGQQLLINCVEVDLAPVGSFLFAERHHYERAASGWHRRCLLSIARTEARHQEDTGGTEMTDY
jgi:hypothetical protein